ncbi:hypothetical protein BGZ92_010467, partial [Podila epicladia]
MNSPPTSPSRFTVTCSHHCHHNHTHVKVTPIKTESEPNSTSSMLPTPPVSPMMLPVAHGHPAPSP